MRVRMSCCFGVLLESFLTICRAIGLVGLLSVFVPIFLFLPVLSLGRDRLRVDVDVFVDAVDVVAVAVDAVAVDAVAVNNELYH